ncbi:MAG: hypothetical protein IJT12_03730 [Paludibacteraceae bacterium]|nr:hypothetical protein [Paludibacteraceae bacterium]
MRYAGIAAGGVMRLDSVAGWSHQNTCEMSYTAQRLDWVFAQRKGQPVVDVPDDESINTGDEPAGNRSEQSSAPAKIFLNGQLYIRHGTTLYTLTGRAYLGHSLH